MVTAPAKRTYTIPEFAAMMGVSRDSYYRVIRAAQARGEQPMVCGIPVIEGPGHLVVSKAKVDALLAGPSEPASKRRYRPGRFTS